MDDFNSTSNEGNSWLDRVKESPRTVSALIIILIVAAAVYAFSGEEPATQDLADEGIITEEGAELAQQEQATEEAAEGGETTQEGEGQATEQREEVTQAQLAQESQELPEASKNEQGYQEVAQAGDGITHLARRATTRWLSENQAGYTVSNEHRIFIEDYIQNGTGTQGLAVGETMTVTYDMIAEAVAAAGQLNDGQLNNLAQYTHVLT